LVNGFSELAHGGRSGLMKPDSGGISDLDILIRSMRPALDPAGYCFASLPAAEIEERGIDPLCMFREAEGTTAILPVDRARAQQWPVESVWARITLTVHSSLSAVGFLAAVTGALAREGIGVNAVSAFHHDHLFVPWEQRRRALQALRTLSRSAPPPIGQGYNTSAEPDGKAMDHDSLLEITDVSLLMIEDRIKKSVVVGVPHHAPAGKDTLPCLDHQEADENTGYLGRYLAEKLRCCSIVACNYPLDSNKFIRSDYSMQIAAWNPKVLVELHGHNGRKAKSSIEISSGAADPSRGGALAERLAEAFRKNDLLRKFTVCGDYDRIYYKATYAMTINDGRWIGYHIELPPNLRKVIEGMDGRPPQAAFAFCDTLSEVLRELHRV
jgi:hypothetical protein